MSMRSGRPPGTPACPSLPGAARARVTQVAAGPGMASNGNSWTPASLPLHSGGLGPTEDDLTRDALADVLKTELELDPAALENVERFFKHLNRPMPERNKVQAMIPKGARMIENTNGTAPGLAATIDVVTIGR